MRALVWIACVIVLIINLTAQAQNSERNQIGDARDALQTSNSQRNSPAPSGKTFYPAYGVSPKAVARGGLLTEKGFIPNPPNMISDLTEKRKTKDGVEVIGKGAISSRPTSSQADAHIKIPVIHSTQENPAKAKPQVSAVNKAGAKDPLLEKQALKNQEVKPEIKNELKSVSLQDCGSNVQDVFLSGSFLNPANAKTMKLWVGRAKTSKNTKPQVMGFVGVPGDSECEMNCRVLRFERFKSDKNPAFMELECEGKGIAERTVRMPLFVKWTRLKNKSFQTSIYLGSSISVGSEQASLKLDVNRYSRRANQSKAQKQ